MDFHTLIIYLIASILLFFLLNYVEKKEQDVLHYSIISSIYIIFLSGICTSLNLTKNNDAIFLVFLFELFIRIFYTNMIMELNFFKERTYIKKYFFTFLAIFCLNTFLISKVQTVFLDLEQIKLIIWILIILYIAYLIKKDTKMSPTKSKKQIAARENIDKFQQREYIVMQYAKLKNGYSSFVKTRYKDLIPIIYAIMIYENKNRPELFRKLDYQWYKLNGKGRKFGIMQIYSKYYIDDENSIAIAIRRLERIYYKIKNEKNIDKLVLNEYYKKENITKEVLFIVKEIKKFNQK